ncbi:hypothetical protein C2G38_2087918 [Gigaspora rosea]|uniref:Uncharacterized protein n=1 Tax=Gigaspora rosea TaxID=44941 RepID=A0A397V7H5_9GLOM|nr:hypothetical protein C2G38_2087918 [Gigaspora rosea]
MSKFIINSKISITLMMRAFMIFITAVGLINALPMLVPEIHVVSPGPGPWAVGSQQTISWWASGILGNPYVTVAVYKVGNDTPLIANNKPLNTGTSKFSISGPGWSLKSTYYTQICIISISSPFCKNGTTFRITKHRSSVFGPNIKDVEISSYLIESLF